MQLTKRSFSFITSKPYWYVYVVCVVLLVLSGWLWWARVYLNPERVFWSTVSTSLSTSGVTLQTSQQSEQSKIKQTVQMELGAVRRAHSLTTLNQGNTEVKTEIIGTDKADYTRYRSIHTDQKNAQGKPLDVAKIVNVWSKSDDTQQTETQTGGHQLLAQAVLGLGLPVGSVPIPVGDLTASQRDKLTQMIRSENVYDINFKKVKKEHKDGHLVYTYDATIQTILYVRLMQTFAKDVGMHELDQVDPNTYQSSAPLKVKLSVDPYSRQLVSVDNGQGYSQSYSGYGLHLKVDLPKNSITSAELQKRLTEL